MAFRWRTEYGLLLLILDPLSPHQLKLKRYQKTKTKQQQQQKKTKKKHNNKKTLSVLDPSDKNVWIRA